VFAHNNSVWAKRVVVNSRDCQNEIDALTDKWHHVVATLNGDFHRIYFNGVLQEEAIGIANCSNPKLSADVGDLFVGTNFNGRIDDVLIYDRELSGADVTALYALEPCCD